MTPPDGARLASLEERRVWLSRLSVAYRLPEDGLLYLPDGPEGPAIAVSVGPPVELCATPSPEGASRTIRPAADQVRTLEAIWHAMWLAPTPKADPTRADPIEADSIEADPLTTSPSVVLRFRGLFRLVARPHDEDMAAWIGGVLRTAD